MHNSWFYFLMYSQIINLLPFASLWLLLNINFGRFILLESIWESHLWGNLSVWTIYLNYSFLLIILTEKKYSFNNHFDFKEAHITYYMKFSYLQIWNFMFVCFRSSSRENKGVIMSFMSHEQGGTKGRWVYEYLRDWFLQISDWF